MGLFAAVRSRKWGGGVGVWTLARARLEFCRIICGRAVVEVGW